MAPAGTALYPDEFDYTGLVALDPADPRRVFISTDVHPASGQALVSRRDRQRHHELFQGETADGGATWTLQPGFQTQIGTGYHFYSIVVSPTNPNLVRSWG